MKAGRKFPREGVSYLQSRPFPDYEVTFHFRKDVHPGRKRWKKGARTRWKRKGGRGGRGEWVILEQGRRQREFDMNLK